jgi:pachytene checkpoint protein 2
VSCQLLNELNDLPKQQFERNHERLSCRYRHGHLIEVNAHSLFSKYFSESGKLVSQLFSKIQDFVDDSSALVFVLVDEVESLTSARKAAVAGNEPSDAIRSVNALLTHLDALRHHPNVFVLCTSNLPDAVDIAFVDRADIKVCRHFFNV